MLKNCRIRLSKFNSSLCADKSCVCTASSVMAHKKVSEGLRGNFISRLVDQIDMDYENPTSEYNKVRKIIRKFINTIISIISDHSTLHFYA